MTAIEWIVCALIVVVVGVVGWAGLQPGANFPFDKFFGE